MFAKRLQKKPFFFHIEWFCAGPAIPPEGKQPVFGQIYFLDTREAADCRAAKDTGPKPLNAKLLELLDSALREVNPFAKAYVMMREVIDAEENDAKITGRQTLDVQLVFDTNKRHVDLRRYNMPRTNEIAAIILGADDEPFPKHSLVIRKRGDPTESGLRCIDAVDEKCDPMAYPLLFPNGSLGWHPGMKKNREKGNVSMLQVWRLLF
jgi:hypothetical protein